MGRTVVWLKKEKRIKEEEREDKIREEKHYYYTSHTKPNTKEVLLLYGGAGDGSMGGLSKYKTSTTPCTILNNSENHLCYKVSMICYRYSSRYQHCSIGLFFYALTSTEEFVL